MKHLKLFELRQKGIIPPPTYQGLIGIEAAGNGCIYFYYHSLSDEMHFVAKKNIQT